MDVTDVPKEHFSGLEQDILIALLHNYVRNDITHRVIRIGLDYDYTWEIEIRKVKNAN